MLTNQHSAGIMRAERLSISMERDSRMTDRAVRLVQVALAIYLLPVLLVVLAMGGLGMLLVGFSRVAGLTARGPVG